MEIIEYLKLKDKATTNSYVAKKLYGNKSHSITKFHNKLNGIQNRSFSQEEKEQIIKILLEVGEDFKGLHL